MRKNRRSLGEVEQWIEIRGARANNLKNVDVRFPVGRLSVITGISGSGKSTLMGNVLLPAVKEHLGSARASRADRGASTRNIFGSGELELVSARRRNQHARRVRSPAGSWRDGNRSGLRSRSIADRQNFALDAGDLHQSLRRNPESLRAIAGLARARLFGEPVLI